MKTQQQPLVSVIMPVYNAERYLHAAIDSILSQTYKNFEFIIVDDASTDTSPAIIKKYAARYPSKITFIPLQKNLNTGGDQCANQALLRAKGKYIARMDADDIATPTRLAQQVAYLEQNADIFLVGSNAYVIDGEGENIGEKTEPETPEAIYNAYFGFHPMIHPTCMFRRTFHDGTAFSYEIKYSANNDYYTFFKLLCKGYKFANLQDKLLHYRIHGKNETFVNIREKFMNALKIRVRMLRVYHYKVRPRDLMMLTMQTVIVFTLPERVLTNVYFFAKGIKKPALPLFAFAKQKTILASPFAK